jgi:FkbM family methyltransferase
MIKNGIYNLLGFSARLIVNFCTIPLLIHLIGVEEYGFWVLFSSLVSIAFMAEGGLSSSTTLFVSQYLNEESSDNISEVLTIVSIGIFILATLAAIVLLCSSSLISSSLPNLSLVHKAAIPESVKYSSLVVWLKILQGVPLGIQSALKNYKLINAITTSQSLMIGAGMIVIASSGGKSIAFLIWHIVVAFAVLLSYSFYSARFFRDREIRFVFNVSKCMTISQYSLWVWLASLGGAVFQQGDKLVIAAVLSPRELGAYGAIVSTASQINSFSAASVQPLLPTLGGLFHQSTSTFVHIHAQLKQSFQLNTLIALTVGTIMILLEGSITNILFSNENVFEYKISFVTAVIIYTAYSLNAVGYYTLLAFQEAKLAMITTLSSGVLAVILIYVGARIWGLPGAVAGNIGFIGIWLLSFNAMNKVGVEFKVWSNWISLPVLVTLAVVSTKLLATLDFQFLFLTISPHFQGLFVSAFYAVFMAVWFSLQNKSIVKSLFLKISKLKMNLPFKSALSWIYLLTIYPNRLKVLRWLLAVVRERKSGAISRFVLPDGSCFEYPLNSAIGRALSFGNDGFESNEVSFVLKSLEKDDVFFDIGANGGFFTVMAAKKVGINGHVYAFEPSERERQTLLRNIEINNLKNVTVVPSAVGDKDGTINFFLSQDGALNSMFQNDHPTQLITSQTKVTMIKLDSFVGNSDISTIKLIKIDVEGAEKIVLEGAKNTLSTINPRIIFEASDITSRPFGYSTKDLFDLISSLNMRVERFSSTSGDGATELFDYWNESAVVKSSNFVAFAKPDKLNN